MASIFFLVSYGMVLGDGAEQPPPPSPDPTADATVVGAFLKGTFTAAYDKQNQIPQYNVHVVLGWYRKQDKVKGWENKEEKWFTFDEFAKKMNLTRQAILDTHLFSFAAPVNPNIPNLCSYTEIYLKNRWQSAPAQVGVAKAFGLPSANVYISKIIITKQDFCGDRTKTEQEAMIMGQVDIFLYTKLSKPAKK